MKRNNEEKKFFFPFLFFHEVQKENIHLLPLGRRANTIPLPPRAVTKNPAFITDKTARPLALAIT